MPEQTIHPTDRRGLLHPSTSRGPRTNILSLASSLNVGSPEIKAAAGIAKSRSYLANLSGKVSDEEAVALADRALLALDTAAANSNEQKKDIDRKPEDDSNRNERGLVNRAD